MGETCQAGSPAQGVLFAPPAPPAAPDLSGYDVILVNISGGKDSQAALDETVRAAEAAGVRNRIVTVFCDLWLPIHSWTSGQLWARITAAGTRPHPIYAAGMPRLSCRFCVLASRTALILAARLDPEGTVRRAAMEQRMGHAFRQGMPMRDIISEAKTARGPVTVKDWAA